MPRLSRTVRRPADAERLLNYARAGETSAVFCTGGHLAQAVAVISDPTTDVRLVTLDIGGDDLLALLQGPGARERRCWLPEAGQVIGGRRTAAPRRRR